MYTLISLLLIFLAKLLDSFLLGSKSLFLIRKKKVLASITIALSTFVFLSIISSIIDTNDATSKIVVSIASGLGLYLANIISDYFKNDRERYYEITINQSYFQRLITECDKYNILYVKSNQDWYKDTIHVQFLSLNKQQSNTLHHLSKKYYGRIIAKNLADYEDYSENER